MEKKNIDWASLGFGYMETAYSFVSNYKDGKWHLDWENPKDRLILVKECGFVCDYDYLEWEDCELCSAKEYCDRYKDHLTEKGGE